MLSLDRDTICSYPRPASARAAARGSRAGLVAAALLLAVAPAAGHDLQVDRRERPGRLFRPAAAGQLQGRSDQRPAAARQPECGEGAREQGSRAAEAAGCCAPRRKPRPTKARVEANLKREQCDRVRGQIIALAQSDQIVLYRPTRRASASSMDDAARAQRSAQQLEAWVKARTARSLTAPAHGAAGARRRAIYFFSRFAWLISTSALAFSVAT